MYKSVLIVLVLFSCSNDVLKPPLIKPVIAIDIYHDQKIIDPYRNLENLNDSTVLKWFKSQGSFASKTLKSIPRRQYLIEKQEDFDKTKSYSVGSISSTVNGSFFYVKTLAGDNLGMLYYRSNINTEEELLYDPSEYKKESGRKYIINYIKPDWKGEKVAVSLSKQGEEISEIIVIDVSGSVLPEIVKDCNPRLGGVQWLPDNSGYIYIHFPVIDPKNPNYSINLKAVIYKLGDDPKDLQEVFSLSNNPELPFRSEDFPYIKLHHNYDKYVFGEISGASSFKDMYYKFTTDLPSNKKNWKLLYKKTDMVKKVELDGEDVIFLSAKNASNFQIAKTSILNPDFDRPEILISESIDNVITDFELTKDGLFFVQVKNGVEAKLYRFIKGQKQEIKTPFNSGKIEIISKGPKYKRLLVSTSGWTKGITTYEYNALKNEFINIHLNSSATYKDFENLVVQEIEVPSHDGVMVPLSVIHKKGIQKDGNNPTLFYGYGSYGASTNPFFSIAFLNWVLEGGVLAIAHVRGGGEKGDAWRKAGFKATKFNTWKDMLACTEYMINEGYTKPKKSAIWGSSAGGVMAGRAMTERPDLYAAVILISPSANMVRGEFQANGPNSIKEFGTVKVKEEFEALFEMDVYHHVKKNVTYPSTLITAGINDGRVAAWIPAKLAARLQASNHCDNPVLFAIDFKSGHGGLNNGKSKIYGLYADALSFAFWQTGHPDYQPE